ncbi:hypothetical protein [Lutispora sp.]|uniref:hypothetical protein n=1 Tax=Lutispora sp. TaxID=2828727 RepID=UPI002B1EBE85|nr:hypothetical protein [Lutispora sp.]MEA4961724.1 hypothetical protein [Lutispora sp.]
MLRKSQWLIWIVYPLLCIAPYFIPALNQLEPYLGPLPFTQWYALLLVAIACVLLFLWSKKLWDPYDGIDKTEGEGGRKI